MPAGEAAHSALKSRSSDSPPPPSPWVIHVAQPEDLLTWGSQSFSDGPPLGHEVAARPGRLSNQARFQRRIDRAPNARVRLLPETISDGYITLRCPDFLSTQQVLQAVKTPVAIIGAGTASQPGVFDLLDIPPSLLSPVDSAEIPSCVHAALDGGPTPLSPFLHSRSH